jgi:hypothetical protein
MSFRLRRERRSSAVRLSPPPVAITSTRQIDRADRVQDLLAEAQVEVEAMKAQLEREERDS